MLPPHAFYCVRNTLSRVYVCVFTHPKTCCHHMRSIACPPLYCVYMCMCVCLHLKQSVATTSVLLRAHIESNIAYAIQRIYSHIKQRVCVYALNKVLPPHTFYCANKTVFLSIMRSLKEIVDGLFVVQKCALLRNVFFQKVFFIY